MIPFFRFSLWFLFIVLYLLPLNSAKAWFEEQGQALFETHWLPMLESPSLNQRYKAINAFYAFPQWGLPVLRKNLNGPSFKPQSWRIFMLLGIIGKPWDLQRLFNIYLKTFENERGEILLGAMERLYWKYRIPPIPDFKLKNLRIVKKRSLEQGEIFQRISANIKFKVENSSSQSLILKPIFDFWIGQPEFHPEQKWFWVKAKSNVVFNIPVTLKIPFDRGKIRVDLRIHELGSNSTTIHKTAFLILDK